MLRKKIVKKKKFWYLKKFQFEKNISSFNKGIQVKFKITKLTKIDQIIFYICFNSLFPEKKLAIFLKQVASFKKGVCNRIFAGSRQYETLYGKSCIDREVADACGRGIKKFGALWLSMTFEGWT